MMVRCESYEVCVNNCDHKKPHELGGLSDNTCEELFCGETEDCKLLESNCIEEMM